VPLLAAVAGYWALAGAVTGWLRGRGVSNPFLTAAIWICADAGVARFPFGGLSWGELGYAFHDIAPARAVASVGGVTLVTYLAVALNAFLAELWTERGRFVDSSRALLGVTVVAAVVVGATVSRTDPPVAGSLRVAIVQGNNLNRDLTTAELDARYLPASHFDLARQITDPVDLIVFPESSMDADPRTDSYVKSNLEQIARRHHAWVLANATVDAPPNGAKALNLDVLFDPNGDIVGTYAKRHLVPYGEYVPFRHELQSFIPQLDQVPRDYEAGHSPGLFPVADTQIGTLICFESAFGYQVRPLVRDGAQVLVVSTNNRSYRRSANSAQHVAISQMRAAETGRPIVHAAISGISAVIDADGVVHDQTKLFERTVIQTTVATTTGETPYVRYGEWALAAAALAVLAASVVALVRPRRKQLMSPGAPEARMPVESRSFGYNLADPPGNGGSKAPARPEAQSEESPSTT